MGLPPLNPDLMNGRRLLLPVAIALGFEGFQLATDDSTSSFKITNLSGSTLFEVKGDGSGGLGASGMSADTIAEFTSAAGVTIDGLLIKDGYLVALDNQGWKLGTGSGGIPDDYCLHDGTGTNWTHSTGDLLIDNKAVTGATSMRLGTDTTATKFAVQNDSAADIFSVSPASASEGTTLVAGILDLNGKLDQDFALTGTGDGANIAGTINHATQSVEALDVSIAQLTAVRSSGKVVAGKFGVTSLVGDTGGDFVCLELASTDGGGTTPTHSGIYCASPLDALIKVNADGSGGFVVGATMTVSPENTAESGYFKVAIGSTIYQVPIYAA